MLKYYSESRSVSLGNAASDLIRRGLEVPVQMRMENGFSTVVLPAGSPKVTSEHVRCLLEDEL